MNKRDSTSEVVRIGIVGLVELLILGSAIGLFELFELSAFLVRIAHTPHLATLGQIAYLTLGLIVALLGLAIWIAAVVIVIRTMWAITKSFAHDLTIKRKAARGK
jgi:hypothetical protein